MTEVTIGETRYLLNVEMRAGRAVAWAANAATRERFGMECSGDTESAAIERLKRWLTWQAEHAAALEALQLAEQSYYRTLAGSAFVDTGEGPSAIELHKESLEHVEAARVRLDEIRARRPD
jgi:hypothetical protein